jgi:Cu/Ag efflux pump CusA
MRGALTGAEETLTVRVYGHELDIVRKKAQEIRELLGKVPGVRDPRIEQAAAEPALEVEVDVDRAARHGLKPGDVRRAVSTLVSGITVGALFQDQKVFDVIVWGAPHVRENLSRIEDLKIDSDEDKLVRLGDIAHVRVAESDSVIRRVGVSRRVDVDANVSGRPLGEVARDVAQRVAGVPFPFEYHAQVLGEHVERRTALRSIYPHLVTALVVIFLLLQAAMGSWRLAALSILGVPVAMFGGFVAVAISGGAFTLGSLLGFLAVLGLTVRNGIGLVRHFQYLEQSAAELFGEELVRRGVREQFVPIVASALVIGIAVLPIALFGTVGGLEIAQPMAVVILGGVVTSTVATLLLAPALYLRFGATTAIDVLELETQS